MPEQIFEDKLKLLKIKQKRQEIEVILDRLEAYQEHVENFSQKAKQKVKKDATRTDMASTFFETMANQLNRMRVLLANQEFVENREFENGFDNLNTLLQRASEDIIWFGKELEATTPNDRVRNSLHKLMVEFSRLIQDISSLFSSMAPPQKKKEKTLARRQHLF